MLEVVKNVVCLAPSEGHWDHVGVDELRQRAVGLLNCVDDLIIAERFTQNVFVVGLIPELEAGYFLF